MGPFWQKFDGASKGLLPLLTTILFVFLGVAPWPIPFWGSVTPSLALIAVYYWAIHRPDMFGPATAFFIGLLCDTINLLPFGLSAFLFVGAHHILFTQRRFFAGHSFFMLWVGFALTISFVTLGQILLVLLLRGAAPPMLQTLLQVALTLAIFPFPAWALIFVQRSLLSQG